MKSIEEGGVPLVAMVSDGTKLPVIWSYTQRPNSAAVLDLIITNRNNSKCFRFANTEGRNIEVKSFEDQLTGSRDVLSDRIGRFIIERYDKASDFLVISAGWPLVLSRNFFDYIPPHKIINLHPGLLPDSSEQDLIDTPDGNKVQALRNLYGMRLFREVLERKLLWTGVTIHYMTSEVDAGPVILRSPIKVYSEDTVQTLAQRVHTKEDELLPEALDIVLNQYF